MQKKLDYTGSFLACFAVITQFILMMQNRQTDVAETLIRFFSYFTILTNLLVALYFTNRIRPFAKVLNHTSSLTAITSFILIVGLVYQFVLRSAWQPTGLQRLVDELLHSVNPLFVFIYWLIYKPKIKISFRSLCYWLAYPLFYALFIMLRGSISGFYPYPFLNVEKIGWANAIINMLLILAVAIVLMLLLSIAGKQVKRKQEDDLYKNG